MCNGRAFSQNMLPEAMPVSPKVNITLIVLEHLTMLNFLWLCNHCSIWTYIYGIEFVWSLCLPLSSLNQLQSGRNGININLQINILYTRSPLMVLRGSHALFLQSELTSWGLASCCYNWTPWCVWQCELYLSIKFHFSLWRYACFVRMLGLGEFPFTTLGTFVLLPWQDIASQWCSEQALLLLTSLQASPAHNSPHLHLVICWQMLWMEWFVPHVQLCFVTQRLHHQIAEG